MSSTDLDAMTKDELLAYGQELGITPMNAGMNKDEIRAAIDDHLAGSEEGEPTQQLAPEQQVTTTKTKDFLNRLLTNPTPGTSQATDYLGRSVVATDKDYLGRALL